ncbi:hypothetical protein LRS74_10300 [Streptomyces sp. LX-29]|uniref:hypothetical protein n=1 Tax=Streptomyces sp. LX-29 TaxID=2900152 RepID=UPI00240DE86F|nr:hypothetical protein [Streptomyces sp. LX-29]WFB07397.1 hypothetical protein LRS74_10300 [Streptomyces sp. LX-29]
MDITRFSAAVATTAVAVLLGTAGATGAYAAPADDPPSKPPCFVTEKLGLADEPCDPETGPKDPKGKVQGFTDWEVIGQFNQLVNPGEAAQTIVECSEGKKVLGGGFFGNSQAVKTIRSFPQGAEFEAWIVFVFNEGDVLGSYDAYAICADVDGSY